MNLGWDELDVSYLMMCLLRPHSVFSDFYILLPLIFQVTACHMLVSWHVGMGPVEDFSYSHAATRVNVNSSLASQSDILN